MKRGDWPRGAVGIVLIVLGVVSSCYFGVFQPAAFSGQVAAFFFNMAVLGGGLWLVMRK